MSCTPSPRFVGTVIGVWVTRSGGATACDDIPEAHPTISVPQARGSWSTFAARPAAPDGDLVPHTAEDIVQEVVQDGEDPRCDVNDGENYL